jgi:hypothetical protein
MPEDRTEEEAERSSAMQNEMRELRGQIAQMRLDMTSASVAASGGMMPFGIGVSPGQVSAIISDGSLGVDNQNGVVTLWVNKKENWQSGLFALGVGDDDTRVTIAAGIVKWKDEGLVSTTADGSYDMNAADDYVWIKFNLGVDAWNAAAGDGATNTYNYGSGASLPSFQQGYAHYLLGKGVAVSAVIVDVIQYQYGPMYPWRNIA